MSSIEIRRRYSNWALLVTLPLLAFGIFYALPILNLIRISASIFDLKTNSVTAFQLETYRQLITDDFFLQIVWRTLRLSILTTIACAVLGYPIALYVVQARGWHQSFLFVVLLLPLMTSVTVTSYGWLILLGQTGIVNNALSSVGLIDAPIRLLQTETAIVIGLVNVLIAFMVIAISASLQSIDPNHVRAARSLGASPATAFLRIVFPQTLPGVRTGCLLVFSLSMSAYATPVVLGGPRLKFVSFLIYQQAVGLIDWPRSASMAVLLLIATTGVLGLASALGQFRQWRRRLRSAEVPALIRQEEGARP